MTQSAPHTPKFPDGVRTPAYVLDARRLDANLERARKIKSAAGCRILLATKAFALPAAFPAMRTVLDGTTASGEYEARLGREEFGKEVHVYAPAYTASEMEALCGTADHIYFNSPAQLRRHLPAVRAAGRRTGLRINPGYSNATLGGHLYDPCAPNSRFGAPREMLDDAPWGDIDVLHAHALCEARHDGSVGLIRHVAEHFGHYVRKVSAVNFGGGHFFNKPDYDVTKLVDAVTAFRREFDVDVILEPGAGLVVDAGYLLARVLDLHRNGKEIAILDASASTHMPDVLEVPYTPPLLGAAPPGQAPHAYILGGKTCMTGDVIGEYAFHRPLEVGQLLIFEDMMQYTFVKNTTFNGTPLPDLAVLEADGTYRVLRQFGYEEFRRRLG
jgi:carboxynorspermidine decarboxylase